MDESDKTSDGTDEPQESIDTEVPAALQVVDDHSDTVGHVVVKEELVFVKNS